MEPSDHLFRREAGRMVATLTRIFGVHNLALALARNRKERQFFTQRIAVCDRSQFGKAI